MRFGECFEGYEVRTVSDVFREGSSRGIVYTVKSEFTT